jgi:hypothetical protein
MLQKIKKIFKFTISRLFFLCIGIGLALVIYSVQATLSNAPTTVTNTSKLTKSIWDQQVLNNITSLDSRILNIETNAANTTDLASKADSSHGHTAPNPAPTTTGCYDNCTNICPIGQALAGIAMTGNGWPDEHWHSSFTCKPIT